MKNKMAFAGGEFKGKECDSATFGDYERNIAVSLFGIKCDHEAVYSLQVHATGVRAKFTLGDGPIVNQKSKPCWQAPATSLEVQDPIPIGSMLSGVTGGFISNDLAIADIKYQRKLE